MASIVISGDTSGAVTLTVPATAGTRTATFPAATGTVMVSGNIPAFSAYNTIATSMPNATFVKLQNSAEEFDTANCYDNATNYRFTPNVAGYYQLNATWACATNTSVMLIAIYKNGTLAKAGNQMVNNGAFVQACISTLIYFNGSTDYVELYGYQAGGTTVTAYTGSQPAYGYFQGFLARDT